MPRVLVTGALGNVGREVARACASAGLTVRVANRQVESLRARFPDAEAVRFDFLDPATWDGALAGCDFVFLLRPPPLGDMSTTLNPFVDAAYRAGAGHIVFLSVAGADRMRWVPHRAVELHLAASGDAWTCLRPGFFAQNLEDAYRRDIVEDGRLYVPAGRGRVAFFDVADAGEVTARVLAEPEAFRGRSLTLTGPAALTFDEVAGLLTRALGRTIRYVPASVLGYAWHLWRRRGLPWMQILVQIVLHVGLRRGDAEAVDPTVRAVLGRDPTPMEGYLSRVGAAPLRRP